ncbi:hypothetical protein BY458DRAFT_501310 [Sporodiniella umbellata]|nr:hypothetical protein BY458DRAFT_501310 [Sporodiniella umbellata]
MLNKNRWSIRQANSRQIQPTFDKDFLEKTRNHQKKGWKEALVSKGLPSLDELMALRTYSPFTQTQFNDFLEQRGASANLQFLIALDRHETLWRAFVQGLDRHQRHRLSGYLGSNKTLPLPGWTQADLMQHATELYQTYGLACHLTPAHRQALHTLLQHQRPEPIVFDSAKEHVLKVLEKFYYPLFVHRMLHQNLARSTCQRLFALATLLLTLAFSFEIAFIFLASQQSRWLPCPLFFFGWSFFLASVDRFSWWSVPWNQSQMDSGVYCQIQDKTVQKIHRKKACFSFLAVCLLTFITTLSMAFIPAHRI